MHQNAAGDGGIGGGRDGWGHHQIRRFTAAAKHSPPMPGQGCWWKGVRGRPPDRLCSNAAYYTDCMQSPVSRPSLLHDLLYIVTSPPPLPLFGGDIGPEKSPSPPLSRWQRRKAFRQSALRRPFFPKKQEIGKIRPNLSPAIPSIFGCNLGKLDRKVEGFLEWGNVGERRRFCMASDAASPIACGGETIVSLFLFSARAEQGLLLFSGREKKIAQWLFCLSRNSLTGIASLLCLLNDATMVHCTCTIFVRKERDYKMNYSQSKCVGDSFCFRSPPPTMPGQKTGCPSGKR